MIAAFHWRGAPDEVAAQDAVREIAARAEQEGFAVHWGRKVLEVRPPVALDKGLGVTALLDGRNPDVPQPRAPGGVRAGSAGEASEVDGVDGVGGRVGAALYAGDDTTDLDAFRGLRSLVEAGKLAYAVCVAVSSEEAPRELVEEADLTIDGPEGVRRLLEALL